MSIRFRPIALALMAALAATPAHATTVVAGFKGGFALTDLTGIDPGVSMRNTFVVGGILGWETHPWFTLLLEPSFAGRGGDIDGVPNSALNLSYFDLPILGKFKKRLQPESRTGPFGVIGPVLGINTQAKLRLNGAEENVAKDVSDFDLGIAVGAGFDWDFHEGGVITAEFRFIGGTLDATSESAAAAIDQSVHNLAYQLTVGWYRAIH